jgi:3-dehydroquinate dehydratase
MHSSHDLNRPEAKRFRVKLTNLNIPKIDLVEVLIDLLEAQNLKSKNLADEYTAFMPALSPLLFTLRSINPCG